MPPRPAMPQNPSVGGARHAQPGSRAQQRNLPDDVLMAMEMGNLDDALLLLRTHTNETSFSFLPSSLRNWLGKLLKTQAKSKKNLKGKLSEEEIKEAVKKQLMSEQAANLKLKTKSSLPLKKNVAAKKREPSKSFNLISLLRAPLKSTQASFQTFQKALSSFIKGLQTTTNTKLIAPIGRVLEKSFNKLIKTSEKFIKFTQTKFEIVIKPIRNQTEKILNKISKISRDVSHGIAERVKPVLKEIERRSESVKNVIQDVSQKLVKISDQALQFGIAAFQPLALAGKNLFGKGFEFSKKLARRQEGGSSKRQGFFGKAFSSFKSGGSVIIFAFKSFFQMIGEILSKFFSFVGKMVLASLHWFFSILKYYSTFIKRAALALIKFFWNLAALTFQLIKNSLSSIKRFSR